MELFNIKTTLGRRVDDTTHMHDFIAKILPARALGGGSADTAATLIMLAAAVAIAFLAQRLLGAAAAKLARRLKIPRAFLSAEFFKRRGIAKKAERAVMPACFLLLLKHIFPPSEVGGALYVATEKILALYLCAVIWIFLTAAISATEETITAKGRKAIRGFAQIAQILATLLAAILAASALMDKPPLSVLAGLGASAAVVMFVFKDTLLGFVASVQLSLNDMLQTGDWISVPKCGADGVVLEIGLTAVKVRNWDNTIVNVPTYSLVSDAYQNWRGMRESGGRRVMRSISIDMQSVKFCTDAMLETFAKIAPIKDYIARKRAELRLYEASAPPEARTPFNDIRPTNIGVFREYLERYLEGNPHVIVSMTHFVRQLQPTEKGLPIELYFFTTTDWIPYENIQSDIFDHVIAAVAQFGLRIFQDESDAPEIRPDAGGA